MQFRGKKNIGPKAPNQNLEYKEFGGLENFLIKMNSWTLHSQRCSVSAFCCCGLRVHMMDWKMKCIKHRVCYITRTAWAVIETVTYRSQWGGTQLSFELWCGSLWINLQKVFCWRLLSGFFWTLKQWVWSKEVRDYCMWICMVRRDPNRKGSQWVLTELYLIWDFGIDAEGECETFAK